MGREPEPRLLRLSLAAVVLVTMSGCAGPPPTESKAEPTVASGSPQEPEEAQELPPGHPPLGAPRADAVIPTVPPGSGTGAAALEWTVPEGWIEETPSSAMRRAQYRVPGPEGDGECVVFYFGPGQGGDATANAIRWAEQFAQPDGSPSRDALKTEQIEVAGVPVLLAEITGTYSGGMTMMGGASRQLSDHMLLGAIAQGGDANWFFKFTGPEATVRAEQPAFRALIDSLSRGE